LRSTRRGWPRTTQKQFRSSSIQAEEEDGDGVQEAAAAVEEARGGARGSANRHVAATRMNERSSRSHCVFTATITAHERAPTGVTRVRYSKLNLIDLAGSERVGRSGATGGALTEARAINRSLAVLGRVIGALVERQRRGGGAVHVPYRDSRLTFLLQESLGGNSRTCIVATVTPAPDSAAETFSTLAFAAGAKKLTCRAVVNEEAVGDAKALQAENARLTAVLAELQVRPGRRVAAGADGRLCRRMQLICQFIWGSTGACACARPPPRCRSGWARARRRRQRRPPSARSWPPRRPSSTTTTRPSPSCAPSTACCGARRRRRAPPRRAPPTTPRSCWRTTRR
jgi:hypothetical protein